MALTLRVVKEKMQLKIETAFSARRGNEAYPPHRVEFNSRDDGWNGPGVHTQGTLVCRAIASPCQKPPKTSGVHRCSDRSLSFRGAGRTTNKVCKEPGTDEDVNKWLLLSQTPKLEGILEGGSSWPNS